MIILSKLTDYSLMPFRQRYAAILLDNSRCVFVLPKRRPHRRACEVRHFCKAGDRCLAAAEIRVTCTPPKFCHCQVPACKADLRPLGVYEGGRPEAGARAPQV